jgi:hypothetical protein
VSDCCFGLFNLCLINLFEWCYLRFLGTILETMCVLINVCKSDLQFELVFRFNNFPIFTAGKPTDEQLHLYHNQFVTATEKLFEDHKAQFGMGDVQLILK